MLYPARASPFFSVPTGATRVSVLSPIVIKELGWILVTFLLTLYLVAHRRLWHLQAFLAAAIVALLIPGLFTDRIYAVNVARFTTLGPSICPACSRALVVAEFALMKPRRGIIIPRLVGVTLAIYTMGSWVASVPLWPTQLYESESISIKEKLGSCRVRAHPTLWQEGPDVTWTHRHRRSHGW